MSQIKIEKGVKLPQQRSAAYPLADMNVGDSFLLPNPTTNSRAAIHSSAKYRGMKVAVRAEGNGLRVWRIK